MKVVALSGGIGGAKLALGLSRVMAPEELMVVANTGDDFEHLGLSISPDVDTLMYALAGLDNVALGWGRRDESWGFMEALEALGGEGWFRLGDRDLAVHVERTRRLAGGAGLGTVTEGFCRALGVRVAVRPMSDDRVRTRLLTDAGWLDFQDYFVRLRCAPVVRRIVFEGAAEARADAAVMAALADPALEAIVICPSNPFISVDPILAVPGVRAAMMASGAPVVAVSPIIGGRAVKGPTAKMMGEMGMTPSAEAVGRLYGDLLDGFVVDVVDAVALEGVAVRRAATLMTGVAEKEALARVVLGFAAELR